MGDDMISEMTRLGASNFKRGVNDCLNEVVK